MEKRDDRKERWKKASLIDGRVKGFSLIEERKIKAFITHTTTRNVFQINERNERAFDHHSKPHSSHPTYSTRHIATTITTLKHLFVNSFNNNLTLTIYYQRTSK